MKPRFSSLYLYLSLAPIDQNVLEDINEMCPPPTHTPHAREEGRRNLLVFS